MFQGCIGPRIEVGGNNGLDNVRTLHTKRSKWGRDCTALVRHLRLYLIRLNIANIMTVLQACLDTVFR